MSWFSDESGVIELIQLLLLHVFNNNASLCIPKTCSYCNASFNEMDFPKVHTFGGDLPTLTVLYLEFQRATATSRTSAWTRLWPPAPGDSVVPVAQGAGAVGKRAPASCCPRRTTCHLHPRLRSPTWCCASGYTGSSRG